MKNDPKPPLAFHAGGRKRGSRKEGSYVQDIVGLAVLFIVIAAAVTWANILSK